LSKFGSLSNALQIDRHKRENIPAYSKVLLSSQLCLTPAVIESQRVVIHGATRT